MFNITEISQNNCSYNILEKKWREHGHFRPLCVLVLDSRTNNDSMHERIDMFSVAYPGSGAPNLPPFQNVILKICPKTL